MIPHSVSSRAIFHPSSVFASRMIRFAAFIRSCAFCAAAIFASAIQDSVFRRVGIRPFLTVVRLDYESWTFLCRKHFEL